LSTDQDHITSLSGPLPNSGGVLEGVVEEKQLAKQLGRHERTIDRWVKEGRLDPPVTFGNLKFHTVEKVRARLRGELPAAEPRRPGRPRKASS
jgi:hypothetical protein